MENVVIIGSGVSGLTAAIYASRAELKPILISGYQGGGQIATTTMVENFPGFPDGILGPDLIVNMRKQAEKFGTRFVEDEVSSVKALSDGNFEIAIREGETIFTKSIIISTGATARWLGIPSEFKFKSRGVHTCATCDGFFYKEKEIIVVGGGDSAMEEATFLSKFASKISIVHRRHEFRASKAMQEKVFSNPKINVIWDSEINEFMGDKKLEKVKLKNLISGEISEINIEGVFLALGHTPNTELFKGIVELDDAEYIKTNFTKTNVAGIFACGDVQDRRYKQAITAAGSGCQAALESERYVESKKDKI